MRLILTCKFFYQLAFTRIITPIRSKACKHLQCFDANIFLTMNEQTPTWSCPVCYRRIDNWEDLFVDEYFMEMLQNTPKHIDSVRVESNGHITIIDENPDLADEESEEEEVIEKNEEKEITTILLDDDDDEVDEASKAAEPDTQQETAISKDTIPNIESTPEIMTANPEAAASPSRERIAVSEGLEEAEQPPRKKAKSDVIDLTLDSGDEGDGVEIANAH